MKNHKIVRDYKKMKEETTYYLNIVFNTFALCLIELGGLSKKTLCGVGT